MQRHPPPHSSAPLSSSPASQSLQAVPLSLSHRRPAPRPSLVDLSADSEEDIHDPRPWESFKHPGTYGSLPAQLGSNLALISDTGPNLPMYHSDENESRRRLAGQPVVYGEKEGLVGGGGEKQGLVEEDVAGKWGKPHGAGPGVGGRRGLPPRQRLVGWVSCCELVMKARAYVSARCLCRVRRMDLGSCLYDTIYDYAFLADRSCELCCLGRGEQLILVLANSRHISANSVLITSIVTFTLTSIHH